MQMLVTGPQRRRHRRRGREDRVSEVLTALPKVGKVKAQEFMAELKIAPLVGSAASAIVNAKHYSRSSTSPPDLVPQRPRLPTFAQALYVNTSGRPLRSCPTDSGVSRRRRVLADTSMFAENGARQIAANLDMTRFRRHRR